MKTEFTENKQEILDVFCEVLKLTDNLGNENGNPISKLIFIKEGEKTEGSELSRLCKDGVATGDIVRPIFANGTGRNGYYDVNVEADNGLAMIIDVVNNFVRKF